MPGAPPMKNQFILHRYFIHNLGIKDSKETQRYCRSRFCLGVFTQIGIQFFCTFRAYAVTELGFRMFDKVVLDGMPLA